MSKGGRRSCTCFINMFCGKIRQSEYQTCDARRRANILLWLRNTNENFGLLPSTSRESSPRLLVHREVVGQRAIKNINEEENIKRCVILSVGRVGSPMINSCTAVHHEEKPHWNWLKYIFSVALLSPKHNISKGEAQSPLFGGVDGF